MRRAPSWLVIVLLGLGVPATVASQAEELERASPTRAETLPRTSPQDEPESPDAESPDAESLDDVTFAAPEPDGPRLRFGVDQGFGLAWDAEGEPGGSLHTGARIGVQLDEIFGLYYQFRIAGLGVEHDPERTVWLVTTSNGGGFDLTIGDLAQFGAGLSVDYLAGDTCGPSLCLGGEAGTYLGIDIRLAIAAFRRHDALTGMRSGVLVGARWHMTALPEQGSGLGAISTLALEAGWELY